MKDIEHVTNQKQLSFFSIGNKALREKKYDQSIEYYVRALLDAPLLSESINQNLNRAKIKRAKLRKRTLNDSQFVAVCGCGQSDETAIRVSTLAKLYETFTDVEIIVCNYSQYDNTNCALISETGLPVYYLIFKEQVCFLEQILSLVLAHPYDLVHLSEPSAANIFFGIFYQLIWGAKIIVDIDNNTLELAKTNGFISNPEYFTKKEKLPELTSIESIGWTKIAVSLINEFDDITVANQTIQKQFGGEILSDQDVQKSEKLLHQIVTKVFTDSGNQTLSFSLLSLIRNLHQQQKNRITHAIVSILNHLSKYSNKTGISVIVKCSNLVPLSKKLFRTFLSINTYQPVEFIVINNASTDDIYRLVKQYKKILDISFFNINKNYTLSETYNFGAEKAKYANLLFLNNNIIFTSDVLAVAMERLRNPEIGIVGIRIEDIKVKALNDQTNQIKHAGIKFRWNEEREYYQPEKICFKAVNEVRKVESGIFPAVSGSFILCQKTDFLNLKGFSLLYNNGLEDIDLCLRFVKQLNKKTWCINDLSLQQVNSEIQTNESTEQNHQVFKSFWNQRCKKYSKENFPEPEKIKNKKRNKKSELLIFEERIVPNISERHDEPVWIRASGSLSEEGFVSLNLLETRLGFVSSPIYSSISKTVQIDNRSLFVFCQLYGLELLDSVKYVLHSGEALSDNVNNEIIPSFSNTVLTDFSGSDIVIADVWFTTDFDLRIRIEAGGNRVFHDKPCVISCYQLDIKRGKLFINAAVSIYNKGPVFIDLSLTNPYTPVLLVATESERKLLGITVLPFPSLCRGGMHNGELSTVGLSSHYMAKLRSVSNSLLTEYFGSYDVQRKLSIGQIAVDIQGATGAEKIFSSPVKEWLNHIFGLRPTTVTEGVTDDSSVTKFIQSSFDLLAESNNETIVNNIKIRESEGNLTLLLPSNALPTISALVSRRLQLPDNGNLTVGSFIVSNPVNGKLRSEVLLPSMGESFLSIQPNEQSIAFPVLTKTSTKTNSINEIKARSVHIPLAILFREVKQQRPASLLFPLAHDYSGSVLRRVLTENERQAIKISVLIFMQSPFDNISAFLNTLSQQTLSDALCLVIFIEKSYSAERNNLIQILSKLFPERYTLMEVESGLSSVYINQAARKVKGRYFLIANDTVLLHDPRSLEVLYLMMINQQVATTSCVMLRDVSVKKGMKVQICSGGIYPEHVDCDDNSVFFREAYSLTAFPNATYPVAGNSFRFILVNTKVWNRLGGLDELNFNYQAASLDFCLNALNEKFIHLCTSTVTACDLNKESDGDQIDIKATNWIDFFHLQETLSSTAVIKDIK